MSDGGRRRDVEAMREREGAWKVRCEGQGRKVESGRRDSWRQGVKGEEQGESSERGVRTEVKGQGQRSAEGESWRESVGDERQGESSERGSVGGSM